MDVIYGIRNICKEYPRPVVAIGVFDGVHRGHKRLIRAAVRRARAISGVAVVMTFCPHPVHVLHPQSRLPLLIPVSYRLRLIAELGVDVCVVIRFDRRFAHLSPAVFIDRYLAGRLKAREVVVGDDFRFGWHRAGTVEIFSALGQEYGFRVHPVGVKRLGAKVFSSSRIRELIARGDLRRAAMLLGRPVAILRRVIAGDGRGKTLGYPTANLELTNEVIPPAGVYVVGVHWLGKMRPAIANIGQRPSFGRGGRLSAEVHLLDFKGNLYDQELLVEFFCKIRDEQFFSNADALIRRIQLDERLARSWFARHSVDS